MPRKLDLHSSEVAELLGMDDGDVFKLMKKNKVTITATRRHGRGFMRWYDKAEVMALVDARKEAEEPVPPADNLDVLLARVTALFQRMDRLEQHIASLNERLLRLQSQVPPTNAYGGPRLLSPLPVIDVHN